MLSFEEYIKKYFGVDKDVFLKSLAASPSAKGYITGAISEVILKEYLESKGFEVLRIKEKPSGGNNAKSAEARGDFYIREKGSSKNEWLVIESKGLKSNSEFRGGKLDNKVKLFKFLHRRAFPPLNKEIYNKGYNSYLKVKDAWEKKNSGKKFPPFLWDKEAPGPEACNLTHVWRDEKDLKNWVESQPEDSLLEESYRDVKGPIAILETHQPSKRVAPITGIDQAAPLVVDFNIMTVDLFLRTGRHEFVFMNASEISHSPTSPEHLYQNYIIDILVKDKKDSLSISPPWYDDILECIKRTHPVARELDESQLDTRCE